MLKLPCHVGILLVQWQCAQVGTSLLKLCAFSSQNPQVFLRCCQKSGRTPPTTLLSGLLPVQMLRFQAGMEGAGWQSCSGQWWWYRTARTAAPTNHQGLLLPPLLLPSVPAARSTWVLGLPQCCLAWWEVLAGPAGGRTPCCGGGCTLCQKVPNLPHFPAWRGSWGLKLLVESRAFHPQGQDGGSLALVPGFYTADLQGVAWVFWCCKAHLNKHATVVVASSLEVWNFNTSQYGLDRNHMVQKRNPNLFNGPGTERGEKLCLLWLNHASLCLAGHLVTGHWAH